MPSQYSKVLRKTVSNHQRSCQYNQLHFSYQKQFRFCLYLAAFFLQEKHRLRQEEEYSPRPEQVETASVIRVQLVRPSLPMRLDENLALFHIQVYTSYHMLQIVMVYHLCSQCILTYQHYFRSGFIEGWAIYLRWKFSQVLEHHAAEQPDRGLYRLATCKRINPSSSSTFVSHNIKSRFVFHFHAAPFGELPINQRLNHFSISVWELQVQQTILTCSNLLEQFQLE